MRPVSHSLPGGPLSANRCRMAKISTHVLDVSAGLPAAGVSVRLFQEGRLIREARTNSDGRCDQALVENPPSGGYQLVFSVGDYFRGRGVESPFLDEVPVHFKVSEGQSYHVPLLVSPWSYSTYRGS
jgi:5-hydroxyisourate hydrolase